MKGFKYLLLLLQVVVSGFAFANSYSSINYKLTPVFSQKTSFIKVEVSLKGNMDGKVGIDFPYEWADSEYFSQIKNIKLDNPVGSITFKMDEINQAIISSPATKKLNFSYEIHQKPTNARTWREVIIRRDLIHSTGHGLFITPSDMKDTDKVQINIAWENIPQEWKTLSDHGIGKSMNFIGTEQDLLHTIYVAGNIRIYKLPNVNNPVYLSVYGNFDELKDNIVVADLSKIIRSQRAFFNDQDFPFYAISLIEGTDPYSGGGTALNKSFVVYFHRSIDRFVPCILFAHEHLHTWIGGKIRNNEQKERLNYWWTEGFTEYYTRILALRSGLISMEDFINECNKFLRNYYLSSVLNEPNTRIEKDFWKNEDVEKLPYNRGFVFAIYLNNMIKKHNPKNSLDNVMLDLLKTSKQTSFSIGHFKNIAKTYIPEGINTEISMFIDKGDTINLNNLISIIPIEKVRMGTYERGFDLDAFRDKKIIKNIVKNSNAYKAGLRDGDKIIEFNFPKGGDPDQIAIIKTKNQTFKFRPENADKRIIYQIKSNLTMHDKKQIKDFFGASE